MNELLCSALFLFYCHQNGFCLLLLVGLLPVLVAVFFDGGEEMKKEIKRGRKGRFVL